MPMADAQFECSSGPTIRTGAPPVQNRAVAPLYVNAPLASLRSAQGTQLPFFLFLLVTATLFLRPGEIVPALEEVGVYNVLILATCLLTGPRLFQHFSRQQLRRQPITLCVVGLLASVVLSHLSHFNLGGAKESGILFLKTVVYYGLLITLIDTPDRLRKFVGTVALCGTFMISLCVIDYLGWQNFEFIQQLQMNEGVDEVGDVAQVVRLRGTGIFQDPNDISMLIVVCGILSIYFLRDGQQGRLRLRWLLPLGILAVALVLTHSRGGLLAAGAAGTILLASRYGRKAFILSSVAGGVLLTLMKGRQSDINLDSGTAHERLLLWREGLEALKSPDFVFGIGQGGYADLAGLVAHNSYLHAYVELGIIGGTFFLGCFFFAGLALYRTRNIRLNPSARQLERFHPYLTAALAGWCVAMMSLSRCYVVPTYLVVGLTASYINLVDLNCPSYRPVITWNQPHITKLIAASLALLVSLFVFVKLFAR